MQQTVRVGVLACKVQSYGQRTGSTLTYVQFYLQAEFNVTRIDYNKYPNVYGYQQLR